MAENPKAWTQLIRQNCRSYPTEHSLVGRRFRHFICDTKSPSPSFGKSRGVVECFLLFEQTEWKVLTQQELSETFWKLKTLTINSPFAEIGWSLASFFSQISLVSWVIQIWKWNIIISAAQMLWISDRCTREVAVGARPRQLFPRRFPFPSLIPVCTVVTVMVRRPKLL